MAFRFLEIVSNDQQSSRSVMIEDVREERACCLTGGVSVHNVNSCPRNLKIAEVRGQHGFKLPGNDLITGICEYPAELFEHHRMRRQKTNLQIRFGGRFCHRG